MESHTLYTLGKPETVMESVVVFTLLGFPFQSCIDEDVDIRTQHRLMQWTRRGNAAMISFVSVVAATQPCWHYLVLASHTECLIATAYKI